MYVVFHTLYYIVPREGQSKHFNLTECWVLRSAGRKFNICARLVWLLSDRSSNGTQSPMLWPKSHQSISVLITLCHGEKQWFESLLWLHHDQTRLKRGFEAWWQSKHLTVMMLSWFKQLFGCADVPSVEVWCGRIEQKCDRKCWLWKPSAKGVKQIRIFT